MGPNISLKAELLQPIRSDRCFKNTYMRARMAWELLRRALARLPSGHQAHTGQQKQLHILGCQILVAKLKNVVKDIFILQMLPACWDTPVVMSCREGRQQGKLGRGTERWPGRDQKEKRLKEET